MITNKGARETLLLLLPFLVVLVTSYTPDYCELCEEKGTHTMCMYPNDTVVEPCVRKSLIRNRMTQQGILSFLNLLRNDIAVGKSSFKLPTAANMHALMWNAELATIAQRWAEQCKLSLDKCRDVIRGNTSESCAQIMGEYETLSSNGAELMILEAWKKAGHAFQESDIDFYNDVGSTTENFAALIWGDAEYIGCGRVQVPIEENTQFIVRLVCNIGPDVAVTNMSVYKRGTPKTACKHKGSLHTVRFPGLCTTVTKTSDSSGTRCIIRINKYMSMLLLVVLTVGLALNTFLVKFNLV